MAGTHHTAAGYGDNQVLSLFSEERIVPNFINENCSAEAAWNMLAMSDYMNDLNPGDVVRFMKFDSEWNWATKDYNGTRRYQELGEPTPVCAQLCAPQELAVKRNNCLVSGTKAQMLDQLFDMQMANTMKRLHQRYFSQVVNMLMAGADSANYGAAAGATVGNINLGTFAAPLEIDVSGAKTAQEIRQQFNRVFGRLQDVVENQDISGCACTFRYVMPKMVLDQVRNLDGSNDCCDWNNTIFVNGTSMFKSFFGREVMAVEGNRMMPIIPTSDGFKAPILYSCRDAAAFAGGIACATRDQEHEDETIVLTATHGGVVIRPRWISYAWVHVKTA